MNQHNMNGFRGIYHYCIWVLILVAVQFFGACKGDGLDIGIASESVGVNVVDTLAVETSTFLLDPLPTTGQGVILAGSVYDEDLGNVKSSSYFRLSNESLDLSSIPEYSRYDSLSITFFYNGYSYGDTTKFIRLNVHRVIEEIDPYEFPVALEDDEYPVFASGSETLLADKTFEYDSEILGSLSFKPTPNSPEDTTIRVLLDDVFGQTLFDMAKNQDTRLTINDDFINFLKGLVVMPAHGINGAMVGFKDSVLFEVHYSYENENTGGVRNEGVVLFPIGSASYQYNHIAYDRTGTPLADLTYDHDDIASSLTGNRTYVQGLTGIVTRLKFPTVKLFVNEGLIAVNKALLTIETDQVRDYEFPPPNGLILMRTNIYGTPISIINSSYNSSSSQTAYLQSSNIAGGTSNGRYVFDMTEYINNLRKDDRDNEMESLLISLPTSELLSAVNHLKIAVNDGKPAIKLHLTYVKF